MRWCFTPAGSPPPTRHSPLVVNVPTLRGVMTASPVQLPVNRPRGRVREVANEFPLSAKGPRRAVGADGEERTVADACRAAVLQTREERLSCPPLHRRREITSLEPAKVLTNYFRPLETAGGIIFLSPSLPGGLREAVVSTAGCLQERKTHNVVCFGFSTL